MRTERESLQLGPLASEKRKDPYMAHALFPCYRRRMCWGGRLSARELLARRWRTHTTRDHIMPCTAFQENSTSVQLAGRRSKHSHAGLGTRILGFHIIVNGIVLALVVESREAA